MTTAVAAPRVGPVAMQGIAIPAAIVDKNAFFARTRRHVQQEKQISFELGKSTQDVIPLRRSDILSEIVLNITGNLTITPGTGSVGSTAQWPYNLLKNVKFSANGASSLVSARGWTLRAREIAKDEGLDDRGVLQTMGGAQRTQGTLALACESWGVGSNTPALAAQTVPVDLVLTIPVAEDQFDLSGAIFLQTSSAELTVELNWANLTDLFVLAGNGTAAFSGTVQVSTTKFEIPTADGAIVVPDLSMFHQLVETSTSALATGENETVIVGQGAGKYVLRVIYQHEAGAGSAAAPVPMNRANFGLQGWRYATSETPDQWIDGSAMRIAMERAYNSDLGGVLGFGVHEFAKAGFRDLVDMATTADLRLVSTIKNALVAPKLWYAVESVYRSGRGA